MKRNKEDGIEKKKSLKKHTESADNLEHRHIAEETMLVTLYKHDKSLQVTMNLENTDITFSQDKRKNTTVLIIHRSTNDLQPYYKIGDKIAHIIIDVTNDPTPKRAGDVVSLGYHCLRIGVDDLVIESFEPLMLSGKYNEKIDYRFVKPLRRLPCATHNL